MSVHPGFGGQTFIKTTLKKIEKLAQLRKDLGLSFAIEVDGGIKLSNVKDVLKAGADWLVVGSAIFSSSNPQEIEDNTKRFKEILNCFLSSSKYSLWVWDFLNFERLSKS